MKMARQRQRVHHLQRLRSQVRHQAGVAVIMVMMIIAIGTALAYALATQQTMVMAQSRHVLVGDALNNLLIGGEVLAKQILREDYEEDKQQGDFADTLNEAWAQAVPPFEIPGGFIEIQARDLHSCFNLNSIATDQAALQSPTSGGLGLFKELLNTLLIDPQLADRWVDWIDQNEDQFQFGAEDNEYLGREVAFRTPNRPAGHLSELRLLAELEYEQWVALQKILCLVPGRETQMNVHTLSKHTLSALNGKILTEDEEVEDEDNPEESPEYADVAEFLANMDPKLQNFAPQFERHSRYFEISVRAELDGETATMVSTLDRDPTTGNITVLGRDYSRRFVSRLSVEIEEEEA